MSGNRKSQDDKHDKAQHGSEERAQSQSKSHKSVTFSPKVHGGVGGNSGIATTNSNRQRHHSHTHHQLPLLAPPQTNGNRHSRSLSYSSSSDEDGTESDEEGSPDIEYPSVSPEEGCEAGTHVMELPENVIEYVFTFLPLPDLLAASMVCSEWGRIANDGNNDVWRSNCHSYLPPDALNSRLLVDLPNYKSKLRAYFHAWNPSDCSRNIYVKTNGFTIHRNPVAQSTDGVRGKLGESGEFSNPRARDRQLPNFFISI